MKKMMKCAIVTTVMAIAASAWAVSETEETIDGVTWRYKISGGAEIIGCDLKNSSSGAIAIPSRLGGRLVMRIGKIAFHGCSRLTSVTIPDSVTSIGMEAFSGCSALTNVTIGSGVKRIENEAFRGCCRLHSIVVDSTNPNFKSIAGQFQSINSKILIIEAAINGVDFLAEI